MKKSLPDAVTSTAAIAIGVVAVLIAPIWWLGLAIGIGGVAIGLVLRSNSTTRVAGTVGLVLSATATVLALVVAVGLTPTHVTSPTPSRSVPAQPG